MPDLLIGATSDHAHSGAYIPTPGAWTAVTFVNSWVNYGSGYQAVEYRLVGTDVEIRGLAKSGASGTTVFTLPPGHRPLATMLRHVGCSSGEAEMTVDTGGALVVANVGAVSVTTFVSLNGIRFSTL
jgi:hypothetical protein